MSCDSLVCVLHEATVYASDVATLGAGQWLNDAILSFFLQHLQHVRFHDVLNITFVTPGAAFVLQHEEDADDFKSTADGMQLSACGLMIFPVNNNAAPDARGGSHWSLLCVHVRDARSTFHHYDSAGSANAHVARRLADKIHCYLAVTAAAAGATGGGAVAMVYADELCPRQANDFDCGVHGACARALLVLCWVELLLISNKLSMLLCPPLMLQRYARPSAWLPTLRRTRHSTVWT